MTTKVTHVAADIGEGEDGEVLEVVDEPEPVSDPEKVAERDDVLRACSVIESPRMVAAWRSFLSNIGTGRSNKLVPFWKQKQQQQADHHHHHHQRKRGK